MLQVYGMMMAQKRNDAAITADGLAKLVTKKAELSEAAKRWVVALACFCCCSCSWSLVTERCCVIASMIQLASITPVRPQSNGCTGAHLTGERHKPMCRP